MPPRTIIAFGSLFFTLGTCWDSRNISDQEWVCDESPAGLHVDFGTLRIKCGTEVLQDVSQVQPIISFYNSSDDSSTLYTLIIVDRDASSAANPTRSPLRHYAAGNIPAALLAAGAGAGVCAWFNYSGPQPPAGTLCHRYYVMLYRQRPGVTPTLEEPTNRLLWDFPVWAANNSLTKVSVDFWMTQNLSFRTAPCLQASTSSGEHVSLAEIITAIVLAVVGCLLLVLLSLYCWRARKARLMNSAGVYKVDSDSLMGGGYYH